MSLLCTSIRNILRVNSEEVWAGEMERGRVGIDQRGVLGTIDRFQGDGTHGSWCSSGIEFLKKRTNVEIDSKNKGLRN